MHEVPGNYIISIPSQFRFVTNAIQLKHMLPQKSGSIVNLASMAGLNGIRASATYAATKHAVIVDPWGQHVVCQTRRVGEQPVGWVSLVSRARPVLSLIKPLGAAHG